MNVNLVTNLDRKDILDCLRLWSLQRTLQKRGFSVSVVDVKTEDDGLDRSEKEAFSKLFPNYVTISSQRDAESMLSHGELNIVTGGKVWSSKLIGQVKKAIILKGIDTKKVAYNVGVNGTEFSFLEKSSIRKCISEFTAVSVSKTEDKEYLGQYCSSDIATVCDNTLLLRNKEYDSITKKFMSLKDYILLDTSNEDPELYELAKKIKKETSLKIVCLNSEVSAKYGFQFEHVKSPQKFLGIVKGAKYVMTNSERSTLFALIFKRPMLYVRGNLQGQKWLEELLQELNLSANILDSAADYKDVEQFKLKNGHALHRTMSECKRDAYEYLDRITGIEHNKEEYVDAPTDILKKDCCGCYACEEVCPVSAIKMEADKKGYYYPVVNKDTCISCSLCKKSCVIQKPRLVEHVETFPKVIAAYNKDLDVRKGSSSGAMFPGMAKYIIENKHGYVAGAKYDEDMNVVSSVGSTMEEVKAFYGSKYCKSLLDGSYKRIKELLDKDEYVLFSGLPCECSALRAFLRKDYKKLYIIEILCHAAPSAKVFKAYVKYLEEKFGSKVTNVTFRQKKNGWQAHQTSMVVDFKDRDSLRVVNRTNNYFRIFANDYISRESCASCRFTKLNRAGDITIGDFWGIQDIHPDMYDNKGASMVLVNNERGLELWDMIKDQYNWTESSVKNVFKKNHSKPIAYKIDQDEFFERMNQGEPIDQLLEEFNDLKK